MTPFNAELAMQGKPVITRDGRKVEEILCFKHLPNQPVRAIIGGEVFSFCLNGSYLNDLGHSLDLFMDKPTQTKEVFINVYWDVKGEKAFTNYWEEQEHANEPTRIIRSKIK